jgi:predicted secreted protein
MADSNAHIGFGAQLQKGDGASPENFIAILGIKSITGPTIKRGAIDVTDMNSPGGFKEYIGGLADGGTVAFTANWLPRDHTQNQADGGFMAEFDKSSCDSRSNWRITLPECAGDSEGYFEFAGIVTDQSMTIPLDNVMDFSGTIQVSGRPTLVILET